MSDLLFVVASGSNYATKLSRQASQLWVRRSRLYIHIFNRKIIPQTLGSFGCSVIPFVQTTSVLIDSMSLVVIALDRYLAVINKSKATILQSKLFCFSGLFLVWALSCAISSPSLFSYQQVGTYVVPQDNPEKFYASYVCLTRMVSYEC